MAQSPAPWLARASEVISRNGLVCEFWSQPEPDDLALILAAPDLLAALREIEKIMTESAGACRKRMGTRQGNALVAAQAAIAKVGASR